MVRCDIQQESKPAVRIRRTDIFAGMLHPRDTARLTSNWSPVMARGPKRRNAGRKCHAPKTARYNCATFVQWLEKVTRASASGRPFRCDEGSSLSAKCGITCSSICPASFSLASASASGPHASLSVSSSVSFSISFTVSIRGTRRRTERTR